MSVSFAHLFVAAAQCQSQFVVQLVKVAELSLYVGQFFLQPELYRSTGLQAVSSQPQESPNLTQFESQALHATDESQSLDVTFTVSPESSLRPRRPRE
jgi:hypothetical protein